jgi:hypothetical protein
VLTPFDVIEGSCVPGRPGLYVVGCYDSRITFYSQQVRALELAYALPHQDLLPANARIAVVGGGAAGLTLAAALTLTADVTTVLFERADALLPLQRGATRRRIDPHIYDWPKDDADHESAGLCQINSRRAKGIRTGMRDHCAATAFRHSLVASARKIRSVDRETRWR